MSGYVLSPRAALDLDRIWDYTDEHWGVEQADRSSSGGAARRLTLHGVTELLSRRGNRLSLIPCLGLGVRPMISKYEHLLNFRRGRQADDTLLQGRRFLRRKR